MINFNKDSYRLPTDVLISTLITEYDISKAGVNILYYKGAINRNEYEYACSLNRDARQVYTGLKEKDPEISNLLKVGFAECREWFVTQNEFTESDIQSIRKDAFFIIRKKAKYTTLGNIQFLEKNEYTSYYRVCGLDLYYYLNVMMDLEKIDVKGISDSKLPLHNSFLCFLCSLFETIQTGKIEDAYKLIMTFQNDYRSLKLPITFYRELNADSKYRISTGPMGPHYLMDECTEAEKPYINFSNNYNILRELFKIISNIYFNNRR